MSMVFYDAGSMTIGVDSSQVEERLGEIRNKAPAVIKVAANYTARETRKEMLRRALNRYAVNAKGKEKIQGLKQRVKATNANPAAVLWIGGNAGMRSDLAYFRHQDTAAHSGRDWKNGPEVFRAQVFKRGGMKKLSGGDGGSKGFLAHFSSGHIGMIQRVIGSSTDRMTTYTGAARWKNAHGEVREVEQTRTYSAPSGTAMHRTVWYKEEAAQYAQDTLQRKLEDQIEKVIARAAAKSGR